MGLKPSAAVCCLRFSLGSVLAEVGVWCGRPAGLRLPHGGGLSVEAPKDAARRNLSKWRLLRIEMLQRLLEIVELQTPRSIV